MHNLADGTEHNHEPTERISVDALEGLLEVAIALVDEAGAGPRRERRRDRHASSSPRGRGRSGRAGSSAPAVERFRYADGDEVTRDKVWHPGAVGILALDDEHVWLTRQPREVIGATASLEIPAGKLDVPGEPPLETAKRELAEEIGKRAEHWEELLAFYTSPGFSDERVWLYRRHRACRRLPSARRRRGRADRDRAVAAGRARRRDRAVRGLQVADRAAVAGARGAPARLRGRVARERSTTRRGADSRPGADAYERGRPGYPREAIEWLWRAARPAAGANACSTSAPARAS